MALTFNDFIQDELPKRPFTSTDGAAGQMLVRSHRPERPRELVWADVPVGGAGGGFDPSAFPAASSAVPEAFLVRQSGAWAVASFAQMQDWLQCCEPTEPLSPCRVTVSGQGVTAGGIEVVIGDCATDLPQCAVTVNGAGVVVAGGVQVVVGDCAPLLTECSVAVGGVGVTANGAPVVVSGCSAVAVEINGEAVTVDGVAVTVNGG